MQVIALWDIHRLRGDFSFDHCARFCAITRDFRLAWFCVVAYFVAPNTRWGVGMAVRISEGHITRDGRDLTSVAGLRAS
jgi:hypothetical protein